MVITICYEGIDLATSSCPWKGFEHTKLIIYYFTFLAHGWKVKFKT